MIKIVKSERSVQILCSKADWSFVRWCLDEGLMAWMDTEPDDVDTSPSGDSEAFKAWKRNGMPTSASQLEWKGV